MKLRPSYDMSKLRLGSSGILNVIMGSGPRLASPDFILGGGVFLGGGETLSGGSCSRKNELEALCAV